VDAPLEAAPSASSSHGSPDAALEEQASAPSEATPGSPTVAEPTFEIAAPSDVKADAPARFAPAPSEPSAPEPPEADLGFDELKELLETPIEVWSATKTASTMEEAPAVVTVITREDLRNFGYPSLAEALQHTLGFYVLDDHIVPNVAVRGVSGGLFAESGVVKVMIDGHSVAFRPTGGSWLGPELVPLSAVERIEIIRGPASALYGADAFLGVVNVVTREGRALAGAELSLGMNVLRGGIGSDSDLTVGLRQGDFDVLVSARLQSEDRSGIALPESSPAPLIPDYNRTARLASGLTNGSSVALAKLTWHASEDTRLTLTGYHSSIDRGAEFGPWTQLSRGFDAAGRFSESRVALRQYALHLNAETKLHQTLVLALDLTGFSGGPAEGDRIEVGSELFYVRRDFGYRSTEANLEARWTPSSGVSVVAGAGVIGDDEQLLSSEHVLKFDAGGLRAGDVLESSTSRQGRKTFLNPGAWLQAQWTPGRHWPSLTGGVRYDHHNIYGSQLSGRFGAVAGITKGLYAKLLYGSAFKAPSPLLLYAVPLRAGDVVGNPELAPQFVHTFEAQLQYKPLDWLSLSTDVAYSILLDKAEFVQKGVNRVARNVAKAGSLTWEAQLQASIPNKLRGYLSAELQHTVREVGEVGYQAWLVGSDNVLYPPFLLRAGIWGRVPAGPLAASAEAACVARRRASDTNLLERGEPYYLPSYWTLGMGLSTVGLRLFPGWESETVFSLVGRNLLDHEGPDPGLAGFDVPLTPRTVLLQLRQEI